MLAFTRLSFARQFLLFNFLILFIGMLIISVWVGEQIEAGVVNRTAGLTALYVDSFITPHLQGLTRSNQLSSAHIEALEALLADTPLGQQIVAFKVWGPDGRILYSPNPSQIGRVFPIKEELMLALEGKVHSEVSNLSAQENDFERDRWPRLIETYAPVRLEGTNTIIAVSEFYQTMDDLEREVRGAQLYSWLVVGTATFIMYLLLAGLVGRASNTILAQQNELQEKVLQLTTLLAKNEELHTRVSRAAARATAFNEKFLRRIASDLHDGPGQDLSLALLRIDELAEVCAACKVPIARRRGANDDFNMIKTALKSALGDMRAILAGLRMPEIGQLSVSGTVERALHDYGQKTGETVILEAGDLPMDAPLSVKITLYRILQESLANSFRHVVDANRRVTINSRGDQLIAEVADNGSGFDQHASLSEAHLGLIGMRERVEILGGTFEVESVPGSGTIIRSCLPLNEPEGDNE